MSFDANVIFVMGPTGSGKSALSVSIAKKLGNAEIVNADALQVYKGFDIGTAKLSMHDRNGVVHHGFDVIDSSDTFSVQDYVKFATQVISDIHEREKIAIVTGGSNMYLQALLWTSPLDDQNVKEITDGDWDDLFAIDPAKAEKLHRNDTRRIKNAIASSKSETASTEPVLRYPKSHLIVMDCTESDWMKSRLDDRVDAMIEQGLAEEAMHAMTVFRIGKGVMQGIGYREFAEAEDPNDIKSITEKIKIDTWRYFRKQLKWLNGKIVPRLPFEPIRVKVAEGSEHDLDNVLQCLLTRAEKIHCDDSSESMKRFVCEKCNIEFPGKDVDWINHIKSSKHKRKRKRLE